MGGGGGNELEKRSDKRDQEAGGCLVFLFCFSGGFFVFVFSCRLKDTLVHFGVCVATCSSGKAQHCREMTLSPSAFSLCFPEMFSLHWEEEVEVSVHLSVNLTVFLYTRCYYDSC